MKQIFLLPLLILTVQADLVITEVMPESAHLAFKGDWWELTNTGPSAVNLDGYSWNDDSGDTPSYFPAGVTIAPNQAIIILEDPLGTEAASWKATWGLSAATTVLSSFNFPTTIIGSQKFSGLSGPKGDSVILYNASGIEVTSVDFGIATTGRSFVYEKDRRPIMGLISVNGKHGAYPSSQTSPDVASPGLEKIHFVSTPNLYAVGSYSYAITAARPGFAAPTFAATGLPSFLTLGTSSGGTATLSSNRPLSITDAGEYPISITAISSGAGTIQDFILTVMNPTPSMILNEYNAVSATNYLNDNPADPTDGPASQDSYFGQVLGNGGNWAEFVVVGNGTAQLMDLRGWKIEIGKSNGSGFIKSNTIELSTHSQWQNIPTGTLLTFIARNASAGLSDGGVNGVNTQFGITNQRSTTGLTWSNVWIGDTTYTKYTSLAVNGYTTTGNIVTGININNSGTQFRVLNGSGQVIFGPVGEGIAPYSGTSNKEVFELENHPSPSISPIVATSGVIQGYDDGASESTFGSPNNWQEGVTNRSQDFTPYKYTSYMAWADAAGLIGSNALAAADPDHDGRSNFQEYAFGGNPNIKDADYPNGSLIANSNLSWTFTRRNDDASLLYSYEVSTDLVTWHPITPISQGTVTLPAKPGFGATTAQFPNQSTTISKQFFRAVVGYP